MLYLGLGDGGDAWDPHGHGQDLGEMLGCVHQDRRQRRPPEEPYRVPADNPFVGQRRRRTRIWAYGLRNPWRMSFDPATGDLWAGDVGQDLAEEVNLIERGGNYGWATYEGVSCLADGCSLEGVVAPVTWYEHDPGCAVTGGAVYRGEELAALAGRYLFGDLCSGAIWALDGEGQPQSIAAVQGPLVSFATDFAGEVYVLQFGSPILRLASPKTARYPVS